MVRANYFVGDSNVILIKYLLMEKKKKKFEILVVIISVHYVSTQPNMLSLYDYSNVYFNDAPAFFLSAL